MNNMIFYGELPGDVSHGVSISNKTNLDFLSESFNVIKLSETVLFSKGPFSYAINRIFTVIMMFFKLFLCRFRVNHAHVFYSVLPTSLFGSLKVCFLVFLVKLLYSKIDIILHIHRGDFIEFESSSLWAGYFIKIMMKRTDKIITLSEFLTAHISSKYSVKSFTLSNCLDSEVKISRKNNLEDKAKLLYFSNLTYEKGIFTLIDAVKRVKLSEYDFVLNVYGDFKNSRIRSKFELEIKSVPEINYLGSLHGEIKFNVMSEHDIFILPSYNEGQPVSIIESMSVGTPIIATNVGYVPSMFWSDYPYLFDAGDALHLEELIKNLIKLDAEKKHMLSERLICQYDVNFSRQAHKLKLINIFNNNGVSS